MLLGVLGWIVLGLVVGFVASKMVNLHGDEPLLGIALGATGAVIGGGVYSFHSGNAVTSFNTSSLLFAAIAAIAVLLIWHGWRSKSAA